MKIKNRICLLSHFGNTRPGSGPGLLEALAAPVFRPADTGVRRQSLTRWDGDGLIRTTRKDAGGWRYFSPVQLVWLLAVLEMREMGLAFEVIREVGESLFKPVFPDQWRKAGTSGPARFVRDGLIGLSEAAQRDISQTGGLPLILGLIAQSVRLKTPLVLRIFPGAEILPRFNGSERHLRPREIRRLTRGAFASVPLTPFIADHLFSSAPDFETEAAPGLCETDRKILDLIHAGNLRSLGLDFENGKPVAARTLRHYPPGTSPEDIPETEADEIKILRSGAKVARIEGRHRIRL